MAQNYKLKKGVLLQAFGDASKTVTNDSPHFTDELARWYLDHVPGVERYFAIIPGRANVPDEIRNRPPGRPGPTIIVPPEKEVPKIVEDFVKSISEPEVVSEAKIAAPEAISEIIPEIIPEKKVIPKVKKRVVATKKRK